MTFAHEGNQTFLDGLVNFEKMHLLAVSLRMLRACRARPFSESFGLSLRLGGEGGESQSRKVAEAETSSEQKVLLRDSERFRNCNGKSRVSFKSYIFFVTFFHSLGGWLILIFFTLKIVCSGER